jgi:F-type H+-transporting ATPase subunit b
MESLLTTVQQLIVRAVPAFLIFTLLYIYLRATLFGPLEKVLAERRQATQGTREAADQALQRAESKATEYEQKLRAARGELYKEQEEMRNRMRAEQSAQLAAAKEKNDWKIREAAESIENNKNNLIANLNIESEALAEQIAGRILRGQNA